MKHTAWAGMWSLANPKDATAMAKSVGLQSVSIMGNDFSDHRRPSDFEWDDRAETLARHMLNDGIGVGFTTWIMPHRRFIEGMADVLVPLCAKYPIDHLMLDAEEPWTQARERLDYDDAASMLAENLIDLPTELFLTGIVYCVKGKLTPLAGICGVGIPQTYTTTRNKHNAQRLMDFAKRRWVGDLEITMHPGLAAYRQSSDTLTRQLRSVAADAPVFWWHLGHIYGDEMVQDAIRRTGE